MLLDLIACIKKNNFPELTTEDLTKGVAQVRPMMLKTFADHPESVIDHVLSKAHSKLVEAYALQAEAQRKQEALLQAALLQGNLINNLRLFHR